MKIGVLAFITEASIDTMTFARKAESLGFDSFARASDNSSGSQIGLSGERGRRYAGGARGGNVSAGDALNEGLVVGEIGRQRDTCQRTRSEGRQYRAFYANARQTLPIEAGGKAFALITRLDLRVCKPAGAGARVNQN
jgi:hypothetical protein